MNAPVRAPENSEFAREQVVNRVETPPWGSTLRRMLEAGVASAEGTTSLESPGKRRVGIVDRDAGFVQTLRKRLHMLAWDHHVLSGAVTPEALVPLRLNALSSTWESWGPITGLTSSSSARAFRRSGWWSVPARRR